MTRKQVLRTKLINRYHGAYFDWQKAGSPEDNSKLHRKYLITKQALIDHLIDIHRYDEDITVVQDPSRRRVALELKALEHFKYLHGKNPLYVDGLVK